MVRNLGRLAAGLVAGSVLAGCGQATSISQPDGHQALSPSSQAVSANGQVVSDAGYQGPVLVNTDRRSLTIGGGGLQYPCFGTLAPFATEKSSVVALWLRYMTPAHHGPCSSSMARYPATVIRLSGPLGSREVVDGATGHPLPWLGEWQILHPSAIPAGLRPEGITPGGPIGDGQNGAAPSGCTQSYSSANSASATAYSLEIIQSSLPFRLPQVAKVPTPIEVRGVPGTGTAADAEATGIMWREAGMYIEILSEYVSSSGSPLSVQQLIAIADSAPPLPQR
jgi:hypothetical protein